MPEDTNLEIQNTDPTPPEPSDAEVQAMEMGWKPKEEFDGDTNKWVPADEFIRRQELFDKIHAQNKKLKDMEKALQELSVHHKRVAEVEYKRALAELREKKKDALETGDADAVIRIEEEMESMREAQAAAPKPDTAPKIDPRFVSWVNRNTWYNNDPEMREYADVVGTMHAKQNPGKDPEEIMKHVEREVRTRFATKFRNPRKDAPSLVETDGKPSRKNAGDGFELSDEERAVMKRFVRQGIMTEEKYIEDLKKVKSR